MSRTPTEWVPTPEDVLDLIDRGRAADADIGELAQPRETVMPDTTTTMSELLDDLRECLADGDLDAARFLRDGLAESVSLGNAWLTPDETTLLESF